MNKPKIDDTRHENCWLGKLFKAIINSPKNNTYGANKGSFSFDELEEYDLMDDDD